MPPYRTMQRARQLLIRTPARQETMPMSPICRNTKFWLNRHGALDLETTASATSFVGHQYGAVNYVFDAERPNMLVIFLSTYGIVSICLSEKRTKKRGKKKEQCEAHSSFYFVPILSPSHFIKKCIPYCTE